MSSDVTRHIRDKLRPMPKQGSIQLYVHRNQKARQDRQPRTATSTLTQLLNYEKHHDDDDRFYILLFSALEQIHCAFVACAFKLGTSFSLCILNIHRRGIHKRCLIVTWLVPHETAAISPQVLCTPYKHAPFTVSLHAQPHVYSVTSCKATQVGCMRVQL